MSYQFSIQTRRGGRKKNEDRADHTQTDGCVLFVLADGMGGHPDGEIAAEIAIRTMIEIFHKETKYSVVLNPVDFLNKSFRAAHHRIIRYGTEQGLFDVPRTTAVACLIQNGRVWWGSCGDSRLYMVRDSKIFAQTEDHSLLKGSEKNAEINAFIKEKGQVSRSTLYSCLGGIILPKISLAGPLLLQHKDRILLCSDGLWAALPENKITALLSSDFDVRSIANTLVESALAATGDSSDNVTVIITEWLADESAQASVNNQEIVHTKLERMFIDNERLKSKVDTMMDEMDKLIQSIDDYR